MDALRLHKCRAISDIYCLILCVLGQNGKAAVVCFLSFCAFELLSHHYHCIVSNHYRRRLSWLVFVLASFSVLHFSGFIVSVQGIIIYRAAYFGMFDTAKYFIAAEGKKLNFFFAWALAQVCLYFSSFSDFFEVPKCGCVMMCQKRNFYPHWWQYTIISLYQ